MVRRRKRGETVKKLSKMFEFMGDPVVISVVSDISLIISAIAIIISIITLAR